MDDWCYSGHFFSFTPSDRILKENLLTRMILTNMIKHICFASHIKHAKLGGYIPLVPLNLSGTFSDHHYSSHYRILITFVTLSMNKCIPRCVLISN